MRLKKGVSSHLEMVIAFTMFTLFVAFLLIYIQPPKEGKLSDSIVINLQASFLEMNKVNMTRVFLKKADDFGSVIGSKVFSIGLEDVGTAGGSIVKTAIGNFEAPSSFSRGIFTMDFSSTGENSFYIHISPDFQNDFLIRNLVPYPNPSLQLGSIEESFLLSNKSLRNMEGNYTLNYDHLKGELRIPAIIDFTVRSIDEEYSMVRNVPEGIEVNAVTRTYRLLYSDGTIKNKEFVFSLW